MIGSHQCNRRECIIVAAAVVALPIDCNCSSAALQAAASAAILQPAVLFTSYDIISVEHGQGATW